MGEIMSKLQLSALLMTLIMSVTVLCGCSSHSSAILEGYTSSEEYMDQEGFQDYADYCKYYYGSDGGDLFAADSRYTIIEEPDIEDICGYFDDFSDVMTAREREDEYDFDSESITAGDYVYIVSEEDESDYAKYNNYTVCLYDMETAILYYLHCTK